MGRVATPQHVITKVSERIKQLRMAAGMTQEQLAEEMSVRQWTISSWERGTAMPEMSSLAKLAICFDTTVGYILGQNDNREPEEAVWEEEEVYVHATACQDAAQKLIHLSDAMFKVLNAAIQAAYQQEEAAGTLRDDEYDVRIVMKLEMGNDEKQN